MATDIDARLKAFWASAPQTKYVVPMIEISHSSLTRTYYLWREAMVGQMRLETGQVVDVEAANFNAKPAGTPAHLDQEFSIDLALVDMDDTMRNELDRIPLTTKEKIRLVYRDYLSDEVMSGPDAVAVLQVESLSFTRTAATISAVAPRLNLARTGELYNPRDIPMLRGFL